MASTTQTLADILGRDRHTTVFSGEVQTVESVVAMLRDTSGSAQKLYVLAPVNTAIVGLPHKVWEDADEYSTLGEDAYEGAEGEARAAANMRRFVEAHVARADGEGEGVLRTLLGRRIEYEARGEDGKSVIKPDNVVVLRLEQPAVNGEIWVLDGVLRRSES